MNSQDSKNLFKISVKGVLKVEERYLLRKNERKEWELLGGKLEENEEFFEERLIQEFKEESGIVIKIVRHLEPWIYEIGSINILIVPFFCEASCIPKVLFDQDGGELAWHKKEELNDLRMPIGYLNSIKEQIPSNSFSLFPDNKILPTDANDKGFQVFVRLNNGKKESKQKLLAYHDNPRNIAGQLFSQFNISTKHQIISQPATVEEKKIYINYSIV